MRQKFKKTPKENTPRLYLKQKMMLLRPQLKSFVKLNRQRLIQKKKPSKF